MDKRYFLFVTLSALVWLTWLQYMEYQAAQQRPRRPIVKDVAAAAKDGKEPEIVAPPGQEKLDKADEADPNKPAAAAEDEVKRQDDLILGSDTTGDDAPYDVFAKLTNAGAMVTYAQLNKFKNEHMNGPLVLLREETKGVNSFALTIKGDTGVGLDNKNWEVVASTAQRVVFRTTAMQGRLQVEKRFTLSENSPMIGLELDFKNLSDEPIPELVYLLTGGNGLPIEGKWYTNVFRHAVVALTPKGGSPYLVEQAAANIAGSVAKDRPIPTYSETPMQFAGVVDQYFASLVVQQPNSQEDKLIATVAPTLLGANAKEPQFSNIGVQITSSPMALAPKAQATQQYLLYNGPKEGSTLGGFAEYHLPLVIHYHDFMYIPIGSIAKLMVTILNFFYGYVHDYGIAIILLTILVRACLFPLSFKSAVSMQKLQALQPRMQEIKERHANDKERLNREIMDLYAKNKVNPFGGCLPIFFQLPIFVGLYQSLQNSFSLRQSSFLWDWTWIEDLAAPDQLFPFGADVPLLGPYFNLLPILAVAQMLMQAKFMSPPATTPELAMQKKMMNYMMVFMGVMFYRVPAGLCVYFITSGAWSLAERKLLPKPPVNTSIIDSAAASKVADSHSSGANGAASWKTPLDAKKKGKSRH